MEFSGDRPNLLNGASARGGRTPRQLDLQRRDPLDKFGLTSLGRELIVEWRRVLVAGSGGMKSPGPRRSSHERAKAMRG